MQPKLKRWQHTHTTCGADEDQTVTRLPSREAGPPEDVFHRRTRNVEFHSDVARKIASKYQGISRKKEMKRARHDVDTYRLIPLVQARTVLWDSEARGHRSKHIKDDNWKEVAAVCGTNVTTVRKKWKNLKDQFRKEYKKDFSDWHLFNSLTFLSTQFPQKEQEDVEEDSDEDEQTRKNKYKKKYKDSISLKKVYIDVDKLIELVQVREPIWDKDDRRHHNSFKLDECWGEVSEELGCTRLQARNKWKHLRDTLRRELRKSQSDWHFFPKLAFLLPQFSQVSYFPDEDEEVNEQENENAVAEINELYDERTSDDEFLGIPDTKPVVSEFTEVEPTTSKKAESPAPTMTDVLDEDVGFFNSLLPHVKKLGSDKKMMLRMKIQEIVYNAVYNNNT